MIYISANMQFVGLKKRLFTCNTDFQCHLTLGLKENSLMVFFGSNTCFTSALSLDVTSEHICALSQTPLKSAAQYMSAFHSTSWGSIRAHSCFTSSHILKKTSNMTVYITPKGCQDLLNNCRVTL